MNKVTVANDSPRVVVSVDESGGKQEVHVLTK